MKYKSHTKVKTGKHYLNICNISFKYCKITLSDDTCSSWEMLANHHTNIQPNENTKM